MRVKNISGGPVHFPAANRDVADGEVVEVPDDTVLPAEYFEQVQDKPAAKSKE
jgi:hypothetical protein